MNVSGLSHSYRSPFSQRPHCQRRPPILRYACTFWSSNRTSSYTLLSFSSFHSLGSTSPPDHDLAPNGSPVFCQAKSISTCSHFASRRRPRIPTHHAENRHGYPSALPSTWTPTRDRGNRLIVNDSARRVPPVTQCKLPVILRFSRISLVAH